MRGRWGAAAVVGALAGLSALLLGACSEAPARETSLYRGELPYRIALCHQVCERAGAVHAEYRDAEYVSDRYCECGFEKPAQD